MTQLALARPTTLPSLSLVNLATTQEAIIGSTRPKNVPSHPTLGLVMWGAV